VLRHMMTVGWHITESLFAVALLHSSLCLAATAPSCKGIVLDAQRKPVASAIISEQWKPATPGSLPESLTNTVKTDATGHFSLGPLSVFNEHVAFMVYDSTGKHGALVDSSSVKAAEPLEIGLKDLQATHYEILPPGSSEEEYTGRLYTGSGVPVAPLVKIRGTVMLPPGKYELRTSTRDSDLGTQRFEVQHREVMLPPLRLDFSPMARHYGHGTPELDTLTDMNDRPFKMDSLQGRWTLIYFWATWCVPCVREGMPKLIAFAEANRSSAGKYRVVAIHENSSSENGTWQEFHRKTLKLERDVWHINAPPFKIVFDKTAHVTSSWGIRVFPTYALVNPSGDLVKGGDLSTLEAELNKP
jgi:thiol-disulfide isomerase/thioredoxin